MGYLPSRADHLALIEATTDEKRDPRKRGFTLHNGFLLRIDRMYDQYHYMAIYLTERGETQFISGSAGTMRTMLRDMYRKVRIANAGIDKYRPAIFRAKVQS